MQIITIENQHFDLLRDAFCFGKDVGRYWRDGRVQVVRATTKFVLISTEGKQEKIAIKPARSLSEAESLALKLLEREELRGNKVRLENDYVKEASLYSAT